jgi:FlaA1/EpsC-like NDP-sugar epimerase
MGGQGEVFVLDMGEPVKIVDLARRMIELSGLVVRDEQNPDGDIEIKITGLRPGEKLYEELLIGDNPQSTLHPRIMRAQEEFISWSEFEQKLKSLEIALNVNNVGVIRLLLQELVAGYIPSDTIMDCVYLEQEADFRAPKIQSET